MPSSAGRESADPPRASTGRQRTHDPSAGEARLPTLIDASALIALLGGEPAATEVGDILRDGAAITALNLTEAVDRLGRRYKLDMERLRPVIDGLLEDSLEVVPMTSSHAWRAAEIRIAHHHRTSCPLSLADVALLAHAEPGQPIASSDSHVLRIARLEGLTVLPLPNSTGARPD